MKLTIDASVYIATRYPSEPGYQECAEFFRLVLLTEDAIQVPTLLLVEVASAAARKTRNPSDGLQLSSEIRTMGSHEWHPLDEAGALAAIELGTRLFLRGADAVYSAVAALTDSTLISLDRELLSRASGAVKTMTPRDWLNAQPS